MQKPTVMHMIIILFQWLPSKSVLQLAIFIASRSVVNLQLPNQMILNKRGTQLHSQSQKSHLYQITDVQLFSSLNLSRFVLVRPTTIRINTMAAVRQQKQLFRTTVASLTNSQYYSQFIIFKLHIHIEYHQVISFLYLEGHDSK